MEVQGKTKGTYEVPVEHTLPIDCFRTYDIRGPVGEGELTPNWAYGIGLVVGDEAQELGESTVIVGRDGRLTGPDMTDALIAGLRESGANVIFIGVVPTPLLYFATYRLSSRSGVMVTASHNPKHHNGFKIVLAGKTLSEEGIHNIRERLRKREVYHCAELGTYQEASVNDDYIQYVSQHVRLVRPLRVVIDAGNGASGPIAEALYKTMGCDVVPLYCDIDGNFPNHHPDPSEPENLHDLIAKVKECQADVGLAFDGDGDRIGVVTNEGEIIYPDRQMMLYVKDVLAKSPDSEIIFDVKCSRYLPELISDLDGHPTMWKTGHSLVKAKLMQSGAPFAGEMSGHIFFNDEWFGFDDGVYVGARLLRILSESSRSLHEMFADFPRSVSTPELKLYIHEHQKQPLMSELIQKGQFEEKDRILIDGLRVEYADGWALVRPSNTTPCLVIRFEADTDDALTRIQSIMRRELLKIDPHLHLPF